MRGRLRAGPRHASAHRLRRRGARAGGRRAREGVPQRLRQLGYVEGRTIVVDYRYADERVDRLPAMLAEIVRSSADVIVSAGPAVTRVARQATKTIRS
jgi:putative ABC transport system substrate-binding protein